MKLHEGFILDKKVNARNYLIEMSLIEYNSISKNILKNNEFQRPRVPSSKSVYRLLIDDIKSGCLMPSLVLALPYDSSNPNNPTDLLMFIEKNKDKLLILDGLQRTYTIQDVLSNITDVNELKKMDEVIVRVELYYNITRTNILYRMLTLNTGHKQMSTRHQIEIVYSDLLDSKPKNVSILKDTDTHQKPCLDTYNYNDLIDGFTSFMDNDYLPIDREDIVNSIQNLEMLNSLNKENADLFNKYIYTYNEMVHKFDQISSSWGVDSKKYPIDNPYGCSIPQIFSKPQTLSGFGAAIAKLIETKEITSFDDVLVLISKIYSDDFSEAIDKMNEYMSEVYKNAKKIGNDQRLYLYSLFLNLFSSDEESFDSAIESAYKRYRRETR